MKNIEDIGYIKQLKIINENYIANNRLRFDYKVTETKNMDPMVFLIDFFIHNRSKINVVLDFIKKSDENYNKYLYEYETICANSKKTEVFAWISKTVKERQQCANQWVTYNKIDPEHKTTIILEIYDQFDRFKLWQYSISNIIKAVEEAKKAFAEEEKKIKIQYAKKYVATHSVACQQVEELNKSITKIPQFRYVFDCKTTKEFRDFKFENGIRSIMATYPGKLEKYYENVLAYEKKYKTYVKKYKDCSQLFISETNEDIEKNTTLEYIAKAEKESYDKLFFKKPKLDNQAVLIISYSSPQGRNNYSDEFRFDYKSIPALIEKIQQEDEEMRLEEEQKAAQKNASQHKRDEMKALLKKQEELLQREQDLSRREHEFMMAVQGHVYAGQQNNSSNDSTAPQSTPASNTPTDELAKLRDEFARGEITFEEYQEKRNKLLG